MRVTFYDPRREYLELKEEIDRAIRDVLESGVYTAGRHVEGFEEELAAFLGTSFACVVGVGSGTAALELAFVAAGIGAGDEVVTVPNTDISTTAAISRCGARVVFADIHSETLVLDPVEVEAKVTSRTKAIVPVHLFGQLVDMDAIQAIARSRNLLVIEDAALALGGDYRGKMAGTMGDAGCFSMNSRKILSAFGDAGVVVTRRGDMATTIRSLRDYGKKRSARRASMLEAVEFVFEGFNARLDEIQAAVLRVKLATIGERLMRRRTIAARYDAAFESLPLKVPPSSSDCRHAYRAYTIRLGSREDRDGLANNLSDRSIDTAIYYAPPLHLQPAYRYLGHRPGDFPVAEKAAETMLSIPIHPTLSDDQVAYVIEAVEDWFH
jgi:dTDP-4-amino-4,6-dideoxygalactose transaminase